VGYGGPSNPTTPNIHVRVGPFPALPPAVFAVAAGHRRRRHECCDLLVWCCMFERPSFGAATPLSSLSLLQGRAHRCGRRLTLRRSYSAAATALLCQARSLRRSYSAAAAAALLRQAPTTARPSSSARAGDLSGLALLCRALTAAHPPDQRVQAAAAMRRRAPVYFFQFQSSSAAKTPELCGGGLVFLAKRRRMTWWMPHAVSLG
jgi:hypothetical protein